MTPSLESNWWEDNEQGPPRIIHFHRKHDECSGGLLSDTRVDEDELHNLDLDVVSILTDDQTDVPAVEPTDEKQQLQQQQGVSRVVEALRSIQLRRQPEKGESSVRALDTPKATRQQRFFSSRLTKAQNNGVSQTPRDYTNREKSFTRTPGTIDTSPGKSPQKGSDEKGIASLRRLLNFNKGKVEPPVEPGLASMGEEDTVQ